MVGQERRIHASIEQVAVMGHPLRRRFIELLSLSGPSTASGLAEVTDEHVGNVSHHLKMLARAGLIVEAPELAKDRRERWWRAVPVSLSWSLSDVRGDPVGEAVAVAAEQENLSNHLRKVRQWFSGRDCYDDRWTSAAFSTDGWVVATPEELAALGDQIDALLVEFRRGHTDATAGRERCFVFAHGFPAHP
jgi:DNA-binding transcriptional ArsR family regulator